MVNVIMHGCNGHMGRVVTELIEKDENVQIVAGIDAYMRDYFGCFDRFKF